MARKKTTAVEETPFMSEVNYNVDADYFDALAASAMVATADDIPSRPKTTRTRTRRPNPFAEKLLEHFSDGTVMVLSNVPGEALYKLTSKLRNAGTVISLSTEVTVTGEDGEVVSFTKSFIENDLPQLAQSMFTVYVRPVPRKSRAKRSTEEPSY